MENCHLNIANYLPSGSEIGLVSVPRRRRYRAPLKVQLQMTLCLEIENLESTEKYFFINLFSPGPIRLKVLIVNSFLFKTL